MTEAAYNAGYADAKAGNAFGTNLPTADAVDTLTALFKDCDLSKQGKDEFKTFDNDVALGKDVPSTASLQFCKVGGSKAEEAKEYAKPTDGQVAVYLFWGKYHKPGYPFIAHYSKLQAKYGDKVCVVGVSMDPHMNDSVRFLAEDKYNKPFPCAFSMAWDEKKVVSKVFFKDMAGMAALSPPHAFVVSKGKVVWHQDHSELGATSPSYMGLMEEQLDLLVTGKDVKKVGDKVEEEESEEEEGEVCDVDLDDLF